MMAELRRPRVVAIVQARMSSNRLPGKVLADLIGHPVLWYVVHRLRHAPLIDQIVVATSDRPTDDAVAAWCKQEEVACFRGSEEDVLARYYHAARAFMADVIVRITADCPLIDPAVVDKVIGAHLKGGADYTSNTLYCSYPDGLDTEVFSRAALELAHRKAARPSEREHVTLYLRNSGSFRLRNISHDGDQFLGNLRWTVDDPRDLEFMRALVGEFGGLFDMDMDEVLQVLRDHPDIQKINENAIRNEGYHLGLVREGRAQPRERSIRHSMQWRERASQVIPSGTQTFSKGPTQFVQGVAPNFLTHGAGCHVFDVDGNEYIDYSMALGAVILGYNHPAVTEAVMRQLRDGPLFSLPHPLEVEVAEMLVETIPCAEMVRFGKNGSDATSGAVRAARAFTGRDLIACCGYHGWQDWYIGTTTRAQGVPEAVRRLTLPFEYNNLASLARIFEDHPGEVAAVIMEPMGVEPPVDGFLQRVAELTRAHGGLLIFDEVVTGFRLALGGAQEYFGVRPDVATIGKGMGNGFPISAVVGRRDVMTLFDEIFFSFTFGGETLSLSAAKATITVLREEPVVAHLWALGQRLQHGITALAHEYGIERYVSCMGLPPRTVMQFTETPRDGALVFKSLFQQECLMRGILFSGGHNICYAHTAEDIDYTLQVYRDAMAVLAEAVAKGDASQRLKGLPVQPVFRQP